MTEREAAILAALWGGCLTRRQIAEKIGISDPGRLFDALTKLVRHDRITRHPTTPLTYSLPEWKPAPEPVEAEPKPVRQQIPTLRASRLDGGAAGTMHMVSVAPWPGSGPAPWEVSA